MYKILYNLANHGLGQPGLLNGHSECKQGLIDKFRIVDVRTLIDGPNSLIDYELNIMRVISYLEIGQHATNRSIRQRPHQNTNDFHTLCHPYQMQINAA